MSTILLKAHAQTGHNLLFTRTFFGNVYFNEDIFLLFWYELVKLGNEANRKLGSCGSVMASYGLT